MQSFLRMRLRCERDGQTIDANARAGRVAVTPVTCYSRLVLVTVPAGKSDRTEMPSYPADDTSWTLLARVRSGKRQAWEA